MFGFVVQDLKSNYRASWSLEGENCTLKKIKGKRKGNRWFARYHTLSFTDIFSQSIALSALSRDHQNQSCIRGFRNAQAVHFFPWNPNSQLP